MEGGFAMYSRTACALIFAGTMGLSSIALSQGAYVTKEYAQSVMRATTINIDGKTQPDRVPQALRLKLFFYRYYTSEETGYHVQLSKELSADDQAVLKAYALTHKQVIQADEAEALERSNAIVTASNGLSADQIASQFEEESANREKKALARYEAVLSGLSPRGREVIERFAYEHVRPKIIISKPSDVAKAAPSLFLADVAERRLALARGDRDDAAPMLSPTQQSLDGDGEGAAIFAPNNP
jgi:hypothetical protein